MKCRRRPQGHGRRGRLSCTCTSPCWQSESATDGKGSATEKPQHSPSPFLKITPTESSPNTLLLYTSHKGFILESMYLHFSTLKSKGKMNPLQCVNMSRWWFWPDIHLGWLPHSFQSAKPHQTPCGVRASAALAGMFCDSHLDLSLRMYSFHSLHLNPSVFPGMPLILLFYLANTTLITGLELRLTGNFSFLKEESIWIPMPY